jgi:hypothetical protein
MVDTRASEQETSRTRGLAGRLLGVLIAPHAAYSEVVASPHWVGAFLVVLIATVTPMSWLLSTTTGQRAGVDELLQMFEAFGRTVSDAEYQTMQRMAPYFVYAAAVLQTIFLPLFALAVAGLAYAILNGTRGARASFRQLFAVVVFSTAITAVRSVLAAPLDYARESMSSSTSLTTVAPFFGDNTFGGRVFGSIDLFVIWWMINLAIGLGVLYKRRAAPIAAGLLFLYGAIALATALIRTALTGGGLL